MRKDRLDTFGLVALTGVTLLLSLGQLMVKEVAEGLSPVFQAGLRSALSIVFVGAWLWYLGLTSRVRWADLGPGLLIGAAFSAEFLGIFLALDMTTLGRAVVIFYSMPVWMTLLAHFALPGERITPLRGFGLALAFAGTAWAILSKSPAGQGSVTGDLFALLGALGWTATAFVARATRLREAGPEAQLMWMLLVSAPVLILAAPLFGPLIRDLQWVHLYWLIVQSVVIVTGGYIAWLWLLSVYPTSTVSSFSFLSPIFGVALGVLVLGEALEPALLGATALVSAGIIAINRRR